MCERAVEEGSAGWCVAGGIAEHTGVACGQSHCTRGREEGGCTFRVMSCPHDVANQVQNQKAGALHDVGRQAVQADVGGELREICGDAHETPSGCAVNVAQAADADKAVRVISTAWQYRS